MAELPSGMVTFLFTDLEGSTPLWEEHPAAMKAALARHDDILRCAVEAHRGHVVKATGDGVMAVCATARGAVAAAVEAQLALSRESWGETGALRVRMGLHTGPARPDDGDYHAPAVNRAARIAGAAHPGQILVSAATVALVEGWTFHDLGEHRLRGVDPMHLFQVVAPGLREDFPPSATALLVVDLPSPPTTFVGRKVEVEAVGRLLGEHRLVTLTGVGGCGKTRLAIETARRLAGGFPDGVRFADLAAVTDERQVAQAVVHALGLADDPVAGDPLARLTTYLTKNAVLCILDNCEHLLDACAGLVEVTVARSGPSRLIATSREPLGVIGEQVYVVPSLEAETEAVRLFAARAAEARAGFAVDDTNREVLVQICGRLDGIPLAIELAAARIAHLSPTQVLDRLDDRFRLLTGRRRRVQRHQTLAATLDWSHDLLKPAEQVVLRRLAVFPASFSLEAAEAVAAVGDVVELLGSLVHQSLVQVVDEQERLRYRMLETVRLYAEIKLFAAGEAEPCRARHRDWVLGWLESVPLEERWLGDADVLTAEHASVSAGLEWSAAESHADALASIAAGVDWTRGAYWREGARWCEEAAPAADGLSPDLQVRLHVVRCRLARMTLRGSADWARTDRLAQCAIDAARGQPSPLHAFALGQRGVSAAVLAAERRDESLANQATDWVEAGVAMSEQYPGAWQASCRLSAGTAYTALTFTLPRDAEPARDHYAAGIAIAPPGPPYLGLRATLCAMLALHRVVAGDTSGALALARDGRIDEVLPPVLRQADPTRLALVVALGATNDYDAARDELRAYDEAARRADVVLGPETVVFYGGVLAALCEDWETASRLLAAGERSVYPSVAIGLLYFAFRDRVRAALGPERSRQLRAEGRAMPIAEARDAALR